MVTRWQRFGRVGRIILLVWWLYTGLGSAAAAEERAEVYARRESWPATMQATRDRLLAARASSPVRMGMWYATAPLASPDGFAQALFPEQQVDLEATDEQGEPLWRERSEWTDGAVHWLPARNHSSTYLFRMIHSDRARELPAGFGSDDGLMVWLNGQQLLSEDVARGPAPDQNRLNLPLNAGENRLLLKVYNRTGNHGFYFSTGTSSAGALWSQLERDFPTQSRWLQQHLRNQHLGWFATAESTDWERRLLRAALADLEDGSGRTLRAEFRELQDRAGPREPRWLELYERICRFQQQVEQARTMDLDALERAIRHLAQTYPDAYPRGAEFLARLETLRQRRDSRGLTSADPAEAETEMVQLFDEFRLLRREALLANPLLDFDQLLFVRRGAEQLGLPQNWQGNCSLPRRGYDNQIALLGPLGTDGQVTTLFEPEEDVFVGDLDLHFDAQRLVFSMPGSHGRYQIWEIGSDGSGLRQVTRGEEPDVDNYDACYLPDERIIFGSTRVFAGVPCVGGSDAVANLFLTDPDGRNTRQLCFDQDHNWTPSVLNNGRVLYTRWEYSDSPHYFTRLLFHMNPDGTGQMEYYASNSLWPNSTFYARAIPGHATKIVGIVSGHHGVPRMGELVLFDPARGRHEADGVVQRIPGYGQPVEPVIRDHLVDRSWPKFLHPYPLSDKFFLVSSKPEPGALWGLYLVDVFDNRLLLWEEPGYVAFEPIPLRPRLRPPVLADRVDLSRDTATVFMSDVYQGAGLEGVPRDQVRALRVYSPHYAYRGMGGHIHIGIDGPWDARRILGTVPVQPDGSALFQVPANTPISVQPLDSQGRALQVMRSWFTAMPGEVLSCVGCHESQNTVPPSEFRLGAQGRPLELTAWHGPPRPFSFRREVQPVLDRNCVGCHDGRDYQGRPLPDLRVDGTAQWRNFTPSYVALHPYVRRPGPESDYHLQKPLEFHASTSELVQMLEKGHHQVRLEPEDWDRLITWIDLNVPDHGTWHEQRGGRSPWETRRREMRARYAGCQVDPEAYPEPPPERHVSMARRQELPAPRKPSPVPLPGWPFDAEQARQRQAADGPAELAVKFADGQRLELVRIPPGSFVMGSSDGPPDEYPPSPVEIEHAFYLGRFEITNALYALFDPDHDSAYISMTNKDVAVRGHPVNRPNQPVVRVSWERAMAFCDWLSAQTGLPFSLPTEAQWEWACRAGSGDAFSFGEVQADFSPYANLADLALTNFAKRDSPKWHPKDERFDDGAMFTAPVGRYQPNAWGLYDMHGNVAEWTRSTYCGYPYDPCDGREDPQRAGRRVARGGAWYDRPARARSAFRLAYNPWQAVYNVGFRVVLLSDADSEILPSNGLISLTEE